MRRVPLPAFLVFVVPALLVLGGCAAMMRTVTNEYPQTVNTARGNLQEAAAAGPVLLEVRDTLFYADIPRLLADAANATSIGFRVHFTPLRNEAANPNIRLVFQFSPAPGVDSAAVCNPSRPVDRVTQAHRMTALVTFCDGTRPILSMSANGVMPQGAEAPMLRALAEQAMLRMFVSSGANRESPSDYWPD